MLKKLFPIISLVAAVLVAITATAQAEVRLRLATTTSTENSGLLGALIPPFEAENACVVDVIAVGTGKALKLGEHGDVDLVLVHARQLEDQFVADGYGVNRRDVMYNDFVIIGPAGDPAGIKGINDAVVALQKIAAKEVIFVSRGDRSGTHFKETQLWKAIETGAKGSWYQEAGRGMGEVIIMANEQRGYTLSDRGTFVAFKDRIDLKVLSEGDKRLSNPYGVIAVNPDKHAHIKFDLASRFISYLISSQGQQRIADYRKNGEQLFFPVKIE